jgi:hypothetical protein
MNDNLLGFPSGRSVGNCRNDARRLVRSEGIKMAEAQDRIALLNGGVGTWAQSIHALRTASASSVGFPAQGLISLEDVRAVLERHPITHFGYGPSEADFRELRTYGAALEAGQQSLISHWDECVRATLYLRHVASRKSINPKRTSYGFKHAAERYLRKLSTPPANCYVSNGAFICAAIHLGFEYRVRDFGASPNVTFNMSLRSPVIEWEQISSREQHGLLRRGPEFYARLGQLEHELGVVPTANPWQEFGRA